MTGKVIGLPVSENVPLPEWQKRNPSTLAKYNPYRLRPLPIGKKGSLRFEENMALPDRQKIDPSTLPKTRPFRTGKKDPSGMRPFPVSKRDASRL